MPMDPVDFSSRPDLTDASWPIGWNDIAPHLARACGYLGCGEPLFEVPVAGLDIPDGDFRFDRLERWSRNPRLGVHYAATLAGSTAVDLRLFATLVGLEQDGDGRVTTLRVRGPGSEEAVFRPRAVVLAAGGLENTRLLLSVQANNPQRFGGPEGPLGRRYMGHVYGSVAEMTIDSPTLDAGIDYFQSSDACYVRRRFTPSADLQRRMGLSNVSFWPDYPTINDPAHRNGVLSFAYLALSVPWIGRRIVMESIRRNYVGSGKPRRMPHVGNVLRDAPATGVFIPQFLYRRYIAQPRMPGFFQRNASRRYAIRFHAEHLPNPESRVRLSGETDALGLPRLAIDLRYSEADTEPLLRAHECFDAWLQRSGLGRMHWSAPADERSSYIIDQCYDGHHQIGTTRMAENARSGVVDGQCRVFGAANLFVAGSSVFATSGAANPTLTATALAMRLAALLAKEAVSAEPAPLSSRLVMQK